MSSITQFDAYVQSNSDLRRLYLLMIDERRAEIVERGFGAAKSMDELEHERGKVAMLDTLRASFEKESREHGQRARYAARTGTGDPGLDA